MKKPSLIHHGLMELLKELLPSIAFSNHEKYQLWRSMYIAYHFHLFTTKETCLALIWK